MYQLAHWIVTALREPDGSSFFESTAPAVKTFCTQFPVPGIA
jgi:hypothetical protein